MVDELKAIDNVVGTAQDANSPAPTGIDAKVMGKWLVVLGIGIAVGFGLYVALNL